MASDSVVCAACGARNRAKWEFCARCGEALRADTSDTAVTLPGGAKTLGKAQPAKAGTLKIPAKAGGKAGKRAIKTQLSERSQAGSWLGVLVVLVLGAVGVYFARRVELPEAPPQGPALVAAGPSGLPSARPVQIPADAGKAFYLEGQRLLTQGKLEPALEQFQKAVDAAPENGTYHFAQGDVLEKLGRGDEALRELATAASLEKAYFLPLARAQARAGLPEAESSYASAIEASPNDADSMLELAELLAGKNRLAEAAPYYEQVVRLRPGDAYAIQSYVAALGATGNVQRAESVSRRYLQGNPRDPVVRARLADLLAGANRTEEAIQVTREGMAANPESPMLHRTLGTLLERAGRSAEAVGSYREYVRMAPNATDAKQIQERADLLAGGR